MDDGEGGRRRSSRIQKLVKEVRYDDRKGDIEEERVVKKRKIIKTNKESVKISKKLGQEDKKSDESVDLGEVFAADFENEVKIGDEKVMENVEEKSDYARIRKTIRAFNTHYLHFVQEEELRVKNIEEVSKKKEEELRVQNTKKVSKKKVSLVLLLSISSMEAELRVKNTKKVSKKKVSM
ncbi:hypothetical protein MKW92_031389, partial [Papaver armeniacum]